MGGCLSSSKHSVRQTPDKVLTAGRKADAVNGKQGEEDVPHGSEDIYDDSQLGDPSLDFREFRAEDIMEATGNFRDANCLSTKGQPHRVYKGTFKNGRQVAVKKFRKQDWPSIDQFVVEASQVGRVRFPSLIPLLGYAVDATYCYLVAEYLPNKSLFKLLFHWETSPLTWVQRLAAAVAVAQTMHHLRAVESIFIYHELTPDRVIFGGDGLPRLSCFGLIRPPVGTYSSNLSSLPPEYFTAGITQATAESVVWSYGNLLLALVSGKSIRPKQFLELVNNSEKLEQVIDSSLKDDLPKVLEVVPLCLQCLSENPNKRPDFVKILLELIGASDIDPAVKGSMRYGSIEEGTEGDEHEQDGADSSSPEQAELRQRLLAQQQLQQRRQEEQAQQQLELQQQQEQNQQQQLQQRPQLRQQLQPPESLELQLQKQKQQQLQEAKQQQELQEHLLQEQRQQQQRQQQQRQEQKQPHLQEQRRQQGAHVRGEKALETGVREGVPRMSRLGRAVAQNNMAVVHECLVAEKYGSPVTEITFGDWDETVSEMQKTRQAGDDAFKRRKWGEAISHYTAFGKLYVGVSASHAPLPLLFARRCFCLLQTGALQDALSDAIGAGQRTHSQWPTAFYLQAAVLMKLGELEDAKEAMEKGAACEPG